MSSHAQLGALAKEALRLRQRGMAPIALHSVRRTSANVPACSCGRAGCTAVGKHPINPGWQSQADLFRNPTRIAQQFSRYSWANVGCVTGSGGATFDDGTWLVVVDVDVRDGKPGRESLCLLEGVHGSLPITVTVVTGSGGLHLYFRTNRALRNSANRLGAGIDVRGEGGQVVAPPSEYVTGARYAWQAGRSPEDIPIARMPEAWEKLMVDPAPSSPSAKIVRATGASRPGPALVDDGVASTLLQAIDAHPLVRWARENPDDVGREVWRGIATNIAAAVSECPGMVDEGRRLFRRISEGYHAYRPSETDRVFRDALRSATTHGPLTFERMIAAGAPADHCDGGTALVDAARKSSFRREFDWLEEFQPK